MTHPVSNSDMASSWEARRGIALKITDAALFLCGAASVAFLLLPTVRGGLDVTILLDDAAITSALLFLCACILVCVGRRFGYGLAVVGGLIGLAWFIRIELSRFESLWIALNYPGGIYPKVGIVSVALIVIATACASLRLLPTRPSLGKSPLYRRTWPAFGVGFLVMAVWFINSVTPYRVPIIVDGVGAELRILHVEKRGLHYNETAVIAYQDSKFYVSRTDRRLFEYRFDTRTAQGVMPQAARARVRALVDSSQLWKVRTPPAVPLRRWNAEGWYVLIKDRQLLAFTTEYRTVPLPEIEDMFHEIENLPVPKERTWAAQDVCLGFCYGSVAALGFKYPNEPCFALTGGTTQCR